MALLGRELENFFILTFLTIRSLIARIQVLLSMRVVKYNIPGYYLVKETPLAHQAQSEERATCMSEYDNFKPEDVVLLTYVKAGTHFTTDIISSIYKEKGIKVSSCVFELKLPSFATPSDKSVKATGTFADLDRAPSPRVIYSHMGWSFLPPKVKEGNVKVIHCIRNPKDVACSMFAFYTKLGLLLPGTTREQFIYWFVEGNGYFKFIREWYPHRNSSNLLNVYYEDMMKDLGENVWKIARFLGVELTQQQVNRVVHANTFKNKLQEVGTHNIMYRKGASGTWRRELTVAQNNMLDDYIANQMTDLDDFKLIFD